MHRGIIDFCRTRLFEGPDLLEAGDAFDTWSLHDGWVRISRYGWAFRIGYPLNAKMITWLSARIVRDFPFLMNHFFVLRVRCPDENSRNTT